MKKVIFSLAVLFLVSNCVVLDNLGLNLVKGTVKGSEAKNQILTGALIGAAATGSGTAMIGSLVTYNTKGIKDAMFYDKNDVDDCAEQIILFNATANYTNGFPLGSILCKEIREHKTFIDWPIPLF